MTMVDSLNTDLRNAKDSPKELIDAYLELKKDLQKQLSKNHDVYLRIVKRGETIDVSIGTVDSHGDFVKVINANRQFRKVDGKYILENKYLVLDKALRGKKISDRINLAGVQAARAVGAHTVETTASLESGGYVWLRKGFWPKSGKYELDQIAMRADGVSSSLLNEWLNLSESDAQRIMLDRLQSKRFAKLFAGSTWTGELDLDSEVQVNAFIGNDTGKSANAYIQDFFIHRSIELEQISDSFADDLLEVLNKSSDVLLEKLKSRLTKGMPENATAIRMRTILAAVEDIRKRRWKKLSEKLKEQSIELSYAEVNWLSDAVKKALPYRVQTTLPGEALLRSVAASNPFQGDTLGQWAAKAASDDLRRIRGAVQTGVTLGETPAQIAKRLIGGGGVFGQTAVQVRTLARTAVHNVVNQSRQAFIQENADLFEGEKFIATLDSRTSDICKIHDGKIFPVGKGPIPPLHFNCRSTRVVNFTSDLFERPSVGYSQRDAVEEFSKKHRLTGAKSRDDLPFGTKGKFDAFERAFKARTIGQVSGAIDYETWIKSQTPAFQREVLGAKRALLLRKGGLKLSDMIKPDGRRITLADLLAKYPSAFDKAGLTD